MNLADPKYAKFALVREMMETASVVRNLKLETVFAQEKFLKKGRVLLTGEGSSRMFPAKNALYNAMRYAYDGYYFTEAATQALEYSLGDTSVFVASNSGKTKEGVRLIRQLAEQGNRSVCGVVANPGTPIHTEANGCYLLACGPENAVAATKSVAEQALFYDLLLRKRHRRPMPDLARLADLLAQVMEAAIPEPIAAALTKAKVLYWAGRNNGVAEELALKTNEITHKKSDFLEGTYAVHGIEEIMRTDEAVIVVDPFPQEEEKFQEVLEKGVGLPVIAIAARDTRFATLRIPSYDDFSPYLQLAAGWNLLVEIGVRLGIDLDRAERARKVGNEFKG